MEHSTRPDIIVAVDLGSTFTGVAWARPQATNALQSPIQVIYNWPGCSTRNEQKVHTCLVYGRDERPTSWGFICEDDDEFEMKRREFFKIFLDKMNLLEAQIKGLQGAPESVAQAQKFVTDYLSEVYVHVKSTIEHQTGIGPFTGWKDLAVEFLFSVPTTWRSFEIINTFKEAIKNAGFGNEGPRHTATVDLTESEAAAVATIKSTAITFEKDDIFLSVDAGGGTTDFALMQVVETREPFPTLKQLTQVDGVGIGSTLIDRAFLDLVEDRVFPFSELVDQMPPDCIEKLVRSDKFRTAKHKFGERVYNASVYKLPMEGVGYNFYHEGAGIESGRFLLTREDMQSIFDPHINSMLKKIREQLDFVRVKAFGNPQVRFLILSGGLGSSAYVRDRLQEDLSLNPHPNAAHIKIVQAHDPQLVVVKGLILDRLQKLETGDKPVLATRKARASYGVMCKMKYNPQIHFQEDLKTDPLDGEVYAMSQIDWLIRKGDDIDPNRPIISTFNQKIAKGSTIRHWDSIIVISHSEREFLPVSMKDSGAKQLCTVRSDLSGVRDSELELMKQKRRPQALFSRSARWYNCTYEVRALVGAADLTFELWFNGQRFSKNHAPIRVTWDDEGAAAGSEGQGGQQGGEALGRETEEASDPAAHSHSAGRADTGSASGSSPVGSVSGVSGIPSDIVSHSRQVALAPAIDYMRINETNPNEPSMEPSEIQAAAYAASPRQLYADLPVDADSIRVLTLQSWQPQADQNDTQTPIIGQLRVVPMDSHPEFTALSYVWGPYAEPRDTVICNGVSVEITANCKEALLALRKLPRPVTVWVDAICINQEDDGEKAIQLPLMEEIYAWSQTVYIWLGPGSEGSDRAMDWLRKASTMSICLMPVFYSQHLTSWQWALGFLRYWLYIISLYTPWRMFARSSCQRLILRHYNSDDISSLLKREYFDRMWTFQEVILAQHPHILCGTKSLDWDDFLRGMDYIHRAESRTSEYTNVTVNLRSFASSQVAAPQKIREKRFDREIKQLRLMKDHMPVRFDRWYAVLQLWMSIDRETMWRQRRMRNKTLGRTSMNAHQGPFSSTCPGWLQGRNLFLIETSYFFLGYLLLVTPYLGSYARVYWEWEQGVSEVTVLIIFISSIYTMAFKALATVLNHYWNPRYIGPFISVFWSHDYDKPNDKSSPSDLFLQAIAHAIKFRKVADAKDRAYALYGVLRSQGVRLSKPDYRQSESTVYYHLYCDLLYWDRASLAFLMDAGITEMPGKPSWVPDWKEAGSRSWLPLNIYTSRPRSGKARKLLDEARSISGDDKIFIRVDGKTLEVLGVIVGPVRTCFGPPRVGSRSVELMLAETATPHDDPTRRDEVFGTNNEESEAEYVFSSLCRFCSSKEQFTSLWVARRRLTAIRRDLADLCHWADLARHDSPCTPAYYSIPKAIFEVLQAKRLTTQFRRKWDGAVLADGSNIEQLFDMVPEPMPDGFQKLYLSISTHLGEKPREKGWSYEIVADMVLVDISGDAEVVRFLEKSLGELAGRRNLFTTAKGHIGSGPPEMVPGDLLAYIAGVPVPMIIRRARNVGGYIVIGPSYVQGLMDGEEIDEMQMEILKLL